MGDLGEIGNGDAPRVRSALFVPANRSDFLNKAMATDADALLIDLEDSVPDSEKQAALATCDEWLAAHKDAGGGDKLLCIRINAIDAGRLESELDVALRGGVRVIMLPKTTGPRDVHDVDRLLTHLEGTHGLPRGATFIWPVAETVRGVHAAYEIATASPRIAYMGGGVSPQGDIARELGCQVTPEGLETLYLRSKLLLDVRAAGIPNPMTGVVTEIQDLEVLRVFATWGRRLGYEGMMVIHPSHIEMVNEIFSPSDAEIAEARGVLAALEEAEAQGRASVTYQGRMVDIAMRKSAEQLLEMAGRTRPSH